MQGFFHIPVGFHIQQYLGGNGHPARQGAQRFAGLFHHPHQLDGRKLAIAGGHIFPEDDMPRLFSADVIAVFPHIFQHIAVAHLGGLGMDPVFFGKAEKTKAAHHRHYGGITGQAAFRLHLPGKNSNHLVAIYHMALFIHRQAAVGIAIKGHRQIVLPAGHQAGQVLHMGTAALPVNVGSIGGIAQNGRFCPQQRKQFLRRSYRGAIGTIHQHLHAGQLFRYSGGQVGRIKGRCLVIFAAGAYLFRLHRNHGNIPIQQHPLYFIFFVIGQLVALRAKDLDAVEFVRVVRSRNDHTGRSFFLYRKVRHRWGGNHSQQHHIGAAGHQAAGKSGLQHFAGKTSIPANHHHRAGFGVFPANYFGQGHAHFLCPAEGKIPVGNAANAIGSKQSAHIISSHFLSWFWFRLPSGNAPKWGGCGDSAAGRPPPFWAARCYG